jgi:hypothetical protein
MFGMIEGEAHVFVELEVCLSGPGFGVFSPFANRVQEGSADNTDGSG